MGTNYFVDSTVGDDTDTGVTMNSGTGGGTGAWATIKHAVEAGSLVAGDIVWVRRIHVEYAGDPTSHLQPAYNGTPKEPIRVIGWPRNTHAVASSDWTNGSTALVIDDADMDREKHCGRFITGPDGFDYLITVVTTASGIIIDREYAGATQANQAATILADEDYALAQAIDDSGWTINKAAWNADADDLPCIDFKDTAFTLNQSSKWQWIWKNLEFRDSDYTYGLFLLGNARLFVFMGCLFHQDQVKYLGRVDTGTFVVMERCICDGSGTAALGIYVNHAGFIAKNFAIFDINGYGFYSNGGTLYLENVNIGVEVANATNDFRLYSNSHIHGRDVRLGKSITFTTANTGAKVSFENYGKVLGAHKTFTPQGEITKVAAGAGGDIPNQRTGGAASLIEILYDKTSTANELPEPIAEWTPEVFVHEFEVDTSSKTYRYYVQSMAIVTAAQLWITVEYVNSYDDTSEYTFTTQTSNEAFTVRADGDDWAEYMEVTGIQPAVVSKVRIKCYCSFQHASDKIYIDPKVKII